MLSKVFESSEFLRKVEFTELIVAQDAGGFIGNHFDQSWTVSAELFKKGFCNAKSISILPFLVREFLSSQSTGKRVLARTMERN